MMYDWLKVQDLTSRDHYAAHSRETFDSVLDVSEKIALEQFQPLNRLTDDQEPEFINGAVKLPDGVAQALKAYTESGLLAAGHAEEVGGMQLPYVIDMAANTFFAFHSISLSAFGMLTYANANLLMAHGTDAQKNAFALPQLEGRYFGTMCLSEPSAGSSLGDITTKATPDGDDYQDCTLGPRYHIKGSKMWISGAEHDLTDNIIHLVLAKIPDANGQLPPGPKGISLFVVPKFLVDSNGDLSTTRNDVVLTGLNHKLGYRGIPNTLLSFGENSGAIGYRIGEPGQGLALMFHMMNEARINIGMGAAMLGYAGYESSLDYARERRQGHLRSNKGTERGNSQVKLIEHPDVKRMLLAQKSFSEGALALVLYCASLIDDKRTGTDAQKDRAHALLELLTPIAKSWPSEWCLEANNLAIQVLGGSGYTRDFPVEQYWRDNRLNMIHEGTHGIQGLDLLGRKVRQNNGAAFDLWLSEVKQTIVLAQSHADLSHFANDLNTQLQHLIKATQKSQQDGMLEMSLAHATPYMQAFGHIVMAWLWLEVTLAAQSSITADADFVAGKRSAMHYFYAYELAKAEGWLNLILDENHTVSTMQDNWF
ncbi:acyl-CoA dehydrogenase [Alcaligenaceae bacterium]|nr:acyl-CoA dehydrogenase [Alcaligenaceae bacterium]